ncbi:hypothetical protein BH09PAT1_BH09PAT1_5350 [soil metagenome]
MWFVYALYNLIEKKIYIGETGNIERRLIEHNDKKGNHFTAKIKGTWKLIYQEEVENRHDALIREKQLKSYKGREVVKIFIK